MSDIPGLATRAVALKLLADRVRDERAKVANELAGELSVGSRWTAEVGGEAVGAVSYAKGRATAAVTDERAFREWVKATHPDEIVEQVRPSYAQWVCDLAKKNGVAADPKTGEIIPGVALSFTDPYVSIRPDAARAHLVIDSMRANGLLALEGELEK